MTAILLYPQDRVKVQLSPAPAVGMEQVPSPLWWKLQVRVWKAARPPPLGAADSTQVSLQGSLWKPHSRHSMFPRLLVGKASSNIIHLTKHRLWTLRSNQTNYNWWKTQTLKCSIITASNINSGHEDIIQKKMIRQEKKSPQHKNTW